MPVAGCSFKQN